MFFASEEKSNFIIQAAKFSPRTFWISSIQNKTVLQTVRFTAGKASITATMVSWPDSPAAHMGPPDYYTLYFAQDNLGR